MRIQIQPIRVKTWSERGTSSNKQELIDTSQVQFSSYFIPHLKKRNTSQLKWEMWSESPRPVLKTSFATQIMMMHHVYLFQFKNYDWNHNFDYDIVERYPLAPPWWSRTISIKLQLLKAPHRRSTAPPSSVRNPSRSGSYWCGGGSCSGPVGMWCLGGRGICSFLGGDSGVCSLACPLMENLTIEYNMFELKLNRYSSTDSWMKIFD